MFLQKRSQKQLVKDPLIIVPVACLHLQRRDVLSPDMDFLVQDAHHGKAFMKRSFQECSGTHIFQVSLPKLLTLLIENVACTSVGPSKRPEFSFLYDGFTLLFIHCTCICSKIANDCKHFFEIQF